MCAPAGPPESAGGPRSDRLSYAGVVRATSIAALGFFLLACNVDATGQGRTGAPPEGSDSTTTGSPPADTGTTTAADTGVVTGGATMGSGDTEAGSSSSEGGSDSSGAEPALVDQGLVGRWFIDEAAEGTDPPFVADSVMPPMNLVIERDEGSPYYDTTAGNRGLRWDEVNRDGRARIPIAGTRIQDEIDNNETATFELVVEVTAVQSQASRIINIGEGNDSEFALASAGPGELHIRWDGGDRIFFEHMFSGEREVLHVVVDTTEAEDADRIRVYADGEPIPRSLLADSDPIEKGVGLPLSGSAVFVLGNRDGGHRTYQGAMRYAAVYSVAMTQTDIAHNAMLLLDNDDEPG